MREKEWWNEHIVAALQSYWVYQHIGNLSPEAQREDQLLQEVKRQGDAGELLREFAARADRETGGARWSFSRQVGDTKIVMMDSRAGRVLDEGNRDMVD